ncbi:MAG: hypothetical protein KJ720_15765, partial [Proteobacteria bacterium]|nr:hypothetical protein [Pseudomonadota bacterium]
APAPAAADYYSELSHDIYREVGLLARRLATSLAKPAGQNSREAKAKELAEEMGRALERARGVLEGLKQSAEEQRENAEDRRKLLAAVEKSTANGQSPLAPLAKRAQELTARLAKARVQNGQAAGFRFGLDSVFQAVYDHCTNQTVRKHLQSMWDDPGAFDERRLEQRLNQAAPSEPPPGGAVRFALPAVLAALMDSTANQRYLQILAKVQSTMEQLFPDANLYVEAEVLGGAPQAPEPVLLEEVGEFLSRVSTAARSGQAAPPELAGIVEALLQEEPRQELTRAKHLGELERHLVSLGDMLKNPPAPARGGEAWVRLLGEALLQMLSLLAGLKAKLKAKEADPTVNAFQAEQQAQAQVGRALKGLELPGDPDGPPLPNAKKVDRLLESLGF